MAYADVSLASTSVSNPVFGANTSFQLSSPWASTGANDQSARNSESATAALGTAQSSTGNQPPDLGPIGAAASNGKILGLPPMVVYVGAGVAVLGLVVAVWFIARRK